MSTRSQDIFSIIENDEVLIGLLLYVGPIPRDIVRLSIASPFVRNRLCIDSFCRRFLSLYIRITALADREISWRRELEMWWKLKNEMFNPKFEIQGHDMKKNCETGVSSACKIERRSPGIVRLSHRMPMVSRARDLLSDLPNEEVQQECMFFQPSGSFPLLPLTGCPSMYYEVKIAKSVPSFGGPIIGYAPPSLFAQLPGQTPYSFGVSLGQLIALLPNPPRHREKIDSPRGDHFTLRKGDVFGVGLIHVLITSLPQQFWHLKNRNQYHRKLNSGGAIFYVTFNGELIYSSAVIDCPFRLAPTIVLSSYGDAVDVNIGAETSPTRFFSVNGLEILKTGNVGRKLVGFYKSTWKYDPLDSLQLFGPATMKLHWEDWERFWKPGPTPKDYWCTIDDQNQWVFAPSNDLLWSLLESATLEFYQHTLDLMSLLDLPHWSEISQMFARSMPFVRMIVRARRGLVTRDQLLLFLDDEADLTSLMESATPVEWFKTYANVKLLNTERELGLKLVSLLEAGLIPYDFQKDFFCALLYIDARQFPKTIYDEDWWQVIENETAYIEQIRPYKLFLDVFKEARSCQQNLEMASMRPNDEFREMIFYASQFHKFGILPFESTSSGFQVLSKAQISEIYARLDSVERMELLGTVVQLFVSTTHFFDKTHWPTSPTTPWVPTNAIEAIHTALSSLISQRNNARAGDSSETKNEILGHLGKAWNLVCFVEDPCSFLDTMDEGKIIASFPNFVQDTIAMGEGEIPKFYQYQFWEIGDLFRSPVEFYKNYDEQRYLQVVDLVDDFWMNICAGTAFWYGEKLMVDTMCSSELFSSISPEDLLDFKPQQESNDFSPQPFFIFSGILAAGLIAGATLWYRAIIKRRMARELE